jgi:hypothetical protein
MFVRASLDVFEGRHPLSLTRRVEEATGGQSFRLGSACLTEEMQKALAKPLD